MFLFFLLCFFLLVSHSTTQHSVRRERGYYNTDTLDTVVHLSGCVVFGQSFVSNNSGTLNWKIWQSGRGGIQEENDIFHCLTNPPNILKFLRSSFLQMLHHIILNGHSFSFLLFSSMLTQYRIIIIIYWNQETGFE